MINPNNYSEIGLTKKSIENGLLATREKLERAMDKELVIFSDIIYLNSSDPIAILDDKMNDITGLSVSTVGGSGDFAQVFINKGADKLDIFDISPPVIFFNELKLAALRNLDFEEYKKLFTWENPENGLFDSSLYQEIRTHISKEAQIFFDSLISNENTELFKGRKGSNIGIGKLRPLTDKSYPAFGFIGSVIQDEEVYKKLQKKAIESDISFKISDAKSESEKEKTNDVIYLSNIPEILYDYSFIRNFFVRGSKKVICTMTGEHKGEKIEIISDEKTYLLEPGDNFKMDGLNARLMGFDEKILFGAIIEFRLEDNQPEDKK